MYAVNTSHSLSIACSASVIFFAAKMESVTRTQPGSTAVPANINDDVEFNYVKLNLIFLILFTSKVRGYA